MFNVVCWKFKLETAGARIEQKLQGFALGTRPEIDRLPFRFVNLGNA